MMNNMFILFNVIIVIFIILKFKYDILVYLYSFYELSLLYFGMKPLLSNYLGNGLYKTNVDISYTLKNKYKYLWFQRWLKDDWAYDLQYEKKLYIETLNYLKNNYTPLKEPIQLENVNPDINPEDFIKEYVNNPKPVVIKGLMKNKNLFEKWSRENLLKNYGTIKVIVSDLGKSAGDGFWRPNDSTYAPMWETSLKDALNPECKGYLYGYGKIFEDCKELDDDLGDYVSVLKSFLPSMSLHVYKEVFIGNKAHKDDEGTVFHCANEFNFMMMVKGKKRWQFISPEHTYLCGMMIHPSSLHCSANVTGHKNTWRDLDELYSYIPVYECILEEGDVLLNPPWWWHSVKNLTDFTIGIPTRWAVPRHAYTNTDTIKELFTSFSKHKLRAKKKAIEENKFRMKYDDLMELTDDIKSLIKSHNYFHNTQFRYENFDSRIENYK